MTCPSGKHEHADQAGAQRHLTALRRKDGAARMVAYPCTQCHAWHVGHDPRLLRRALVNARRAGGYADAVQRRRRTR